MDLYTFLKNIEKVKIFKNSDVGNPCRKLDTSSLCLLIHDETTVWFLPINTLSLRIVDSQSLDIYKVPYSLRKALGSFTGTSLMSKSSQKFMKKIKWQNAFDSVESKLVVNLSKKWAQELKNSIKSVAEN